MSNSKKHRDRWIEEIRQYTHQENDEDIIKLCLSYTLQSLRHGENLKRFQWGDKCE